MFEFKHPKYYKELRKLRNNLDQAISDSPESRVRDSVRPGPGLKQQAPSCKPQANQNLVQVLQIFNTSLKLQAASIKLQAASYKLHDPGT